MVQPTNSTATITLARGSSYADKLRAYQVVLDGKVIGQISDGATETFNVSTGHHTLRLKLDWGRSNTIAFESTDGENVGFTCVSSLQGPKVILSIIYATVLAHRYIKLERLE